MSKRSFFVLMAGLLAVGGIEPASAAAPVKIAEIASVDDLNAEISAKLTEIADGFQSEQAFEQNGAQVRQAASVLAVLAQALADTDQSSGLKPAAPTLREAARKIAGTKDFKEAKAAFEQAKAAASGKAESAAPADYDWGKLAKMHPLMEELNGRSAKLRRELRRLRNPDEARRGAMTMALIAVATQADTHEVKQEQDLPEWRKHAQDLQQSMTELAAAIKAKDTAKANTVFVAGMETCKSCHEKFKDIP